MKLGWELESLFCAPESGADEGGGTATAVDKDDGPHYTAVDPVYGEADKSAEETETPEAGKLDKSGKDEKPPADEASDEDSGKTPDEAAEDEDEVPVFSDDLIDRAVALGWSRSRLERFRNEDSLARELTRVEQLDKRVKQSEAKAQGKDDAQAPKEPDWAALKVAGYDEGQLDRERELFKRSVDAFKEAKEARREAAEMRRYLEGLQAQQDMQEWIAKTDRFETTLQELIEETEGYKELFGEGSAAKLKRTGTEFQNRSRVLTRKLSIEDEYTRLGVPLPSEQELLQQAVGSLFNGHSQKIARQKLKEDIKKAGSQALARPQSTGKQGLTGLQKAEMRVEEFWRTHS